MDTIKLAQKFVNIPQWRWMPGMKTLEGDRVIASYNGGETAYIDSLEPSYTQSYNLFPPELDAIGEIPEPGTHIGREFSFRKLSEDQLPDLSDPATMGCIVSLLRVTFGSNTASATKDYTGWVVDVESDGVIPSALPYRPTEAEAIYAAFVYINE